MESSGQCDSLWLTQSRLPSYGPLNDDITVDACVVGAGISGLSVAYHLTRDGRRVVVLEDGANVGSGETGRTTAHLTNANDDRFFEIERIHGIEAAKMCAASHSAAIDSIERIVAEEDISCDFERIDGYLFLAPGDSPSMLENELSAARRSGLGDVELLPRSPAAPFDTGPCLRFPQQAQMHPTRYLAGLAHAAIRHGATIHAATHVEGVEDGRPARVHVRGGHVVTATDVIVATNSPINDRVKMHTKQTAWRTFVVGARIPTGAVPHALLWDTGHPYHYVRVASGAREDILLVGGEDHKTGQADDARERWARLESWARVRFPMLQDVVFQWSGQVTEPMDHVAFIGRNPGDAHVHVVTGDSGQGMTHGALAGILVTDIVAGRESPWEKLYDPARKPIHALKAFARENVNAAAAYRGWLTPGEVREVTEVHCGEGAVLRRGLEKVACYRDEEGVVHEMSATCPHLGSIVMWNSAEKTWDCPSHGSRFDPRGCVLNGPANDDLHEPSHGPSRKTSEASTG